MNARLIVAAAGSGERLRMNAPKALAALAGRPLLVHTLERFAASQLITGAVVIYPPGHRDAFRQALDECLPGKTFELVEGGAERQRSVANGLRAIGADTDIVVIHDAARPFLDKNTLDKVLSAAGEMGAATVATACVDTILQVNAQGLLETTPDRAHLWACQTPQVFRTDIIRGAHEQAAQQGKTYTDDATMVHEAGHPVRVVPSPPENIKITTRADLEFAQYRIREQRV